jgi:predicted TIM-barrel fold metal-dependent hydrolase
VTHADRGFIEEVHFGSTTSESSRVWWDVAWVWGPPEGHLEMLLATMGASRFLFGSGQPLRIPETPAARLDLLRLAPADRQAITSGNAQQLSTRSTKSA